MSETKQFWYSLLAIFVIVSVVTATVNTDSSPTGYAWWSRVTQHAEQAQQAAQNVAGAVQEAVRVRDCVGQNGEYTLTLNQPCSYRGRTITVTEARPNGWRGEAIGATIRVEQPTDVYCGVNLRAGTHEQQYLTVDGGTSVECAASFCDFRGVRVDVIRVPSNTRAVVRLEPGREQSRPNVDAIAIPSNRDQDLQPNTFYHVPGTNNILRTGMIINGKATVRICPPR